MPEAPSSRTMNTSLDRTSTLKTAGLAAALAFLATEAAAAVVYTDISPDATASTFGPIWASFNPVSGATNTGSSQAHPISLLNCVGNYTLYFGCSGGNVSSMGFLAAPV